MPAAFAGFTGGACGQERHERVAHLPAQGTEEEPRRLVEALLIAHRLILIQRLRVAIETREMYMVPTRLDMQIAAAVQILRDPLLPTKPAQPPPRAERSSRFVAMVSQYGGALH